MDNPHMVRQDTHNPPSRCRDNLHSSLMRRAIHSRSSHMASSRRTISRIRISRAMRSHSLCNLYSNRWHHLLSSKQNSLNPFSPRNRKQVNRPSLRNRLSLHSLQTQKMTLINVRNDWRS